MPAGMRIRVYSGALTDPHDADPRLVRRFIAGSGECGRIRFGDGRVTLRLPGLERAGGHQRAFLDGYGNRSVVMLRKADGTGFFVIPDDHAGFAPGQYRLRMTYSMDNRGIDSPRQILRQGGDSSPESVWIDLPWRSR
jgi:hypothetical protein